MYVHIVDVYAHSYLYAESDTLIVFTHATMDVASYLDLQTVLLLIRGRDVNSLYHRSIHGWKDT